MNPALEPYHALIHRLKTAQEATGEILKVVGVTSCNRGEGTSTIAANLAAAAAETATNPVLLVDLNVAHPSQAANFRPSRNEATRAPDSSAWAANAQPTSREHLFLVTPRLTDEEQVADGAPSGLRELVEHSQDDFDLIVVDLPVVAETGPCLALASTLPGVLLVIEAESTRYEVASRALAQLAQSGVKVLGAVLNKRPQHIPEWLYKRI
jgi:Mrp family chromosome partitioning ATPase